jgi:hypothetical protein
MGAVAWAMRQRSGSHPRSSGVEAAVATFERHLAASDIFDDIGGLQQLSIVLAESPYGD